MTTASEKRCGDTSAAIATWTVESRRTSRNGVSAKTYHLPFQEPTPPMNPTPNFKTAFCDRFAHPQVNFEKEVFWNALHPEMRPVAFLIRKLWPGFFHSDLDCIRSIANAESKQEVRAIIASLHYDPKFNRGFIRRVLRVRISGRRIMRLAGRVLAGES